jgi:hypothetical protein
MVRLDKPKLVNHNDKSYIIFDYKQNANIPIIIDANIYNVILKLDKSWNINDKGFVIAKYKLNDGSNKEITLHDIVMMTIEKDKYKYKPIVHINKLGFDNRYENLMYDEINKDINKNMRKNMRKKKRTIELPDDCGFDVKKIPTYIWYLKPDETHGERFVVNIGDINWKTTSSNSFCLKYKLEEAKKYLRHLKTKRPDLFEDHSMNGDLNKIGLDLLKSFDQIVRKHGYKINLDEIRTNTDDLLAEDTNGLSQAEKYILKKYSPDANTSSNAKLNYDKFLDSLNESLPEHCYYASHMSGEYLYIEGHPNCKRILKTTKSLNVLFNDKMKELKNMLDKIK